MFAAPAKVGAESFFGVGSYESNVLKFSPAFWDTHTLVQESFRPPLRIRTHPFRKVFARLFQKAVRSRAHSPCRSPQRAKCSLRRFFLQSFFFGLLLQRKSVKGFSGSKPSLLVGGYPWGLWVLFIKDNPSVCLRQPPSRCGSVTLGL